jgi:hypothetical protein
VGDDMAREISPLLYYSAAIPYHGGPSLGLLYHADVDVQTAEAVKEGCR